MAMDDGVLKVVLDVVVVVGLNDGESVNGSGFMLNGMRLLGQFPLHSNAFAFRVFTVISLQLASAERSQ